MPGEIKKNVWKELKSMKKREPLDLVKMKKKIGCTISYLSQLCKNARDCDYLEFNSGGDYIIKKIPKDYEEFKSNINRALYDHRDRVRGTRNPKRMKATPNQIAKLEINEETIVEVVKHLVREAKQNKEKEEKMKKLLSYAKKIKKERDELLTLVDQTM